MKLSGEMEKMLDVIKSNDAELIEGNDSRKRYFAPNIPDKIMNKLLKYYDSHLQVNSVIAFYDSSLFATSKDGVIFTNDGFYHKFLGKPIYLHYSSIKRVFTDGKNVIVEYKINGELNQSTIYCMLECNTLKKVLDKLIDIDNIHGQTSSKSSGKVKKIDIPEEMMNKCKGIIHTASVASGGVGTGLAQIPASDNAIIMPIQITMITSLGLVFDLHITESAAKSIITSAMASIAGRTISQFILGWIPVLGNAINTATAAGITELIGWIAVSNFYERWLEDKNKGRLEGMKDGYNAASGEYERKLRNQAEKFMNQTKNVERERDEYEELLSEYERYISELESERVSAEHIGDIKNQYDSLKNLSIKE